MMLCSLKQNRQKSCQKCAPPVLLSELERGLTVVSKETFKRETKLFNDYIIVTSKKL